MQSLWPRKEQDQARCDAVIEATLATIDKTSDAELRHASLRRLLDLTYERLKDT